MKPKEMKSADHQRSISAAIVCHDAPTIMYTLNQNNLLLLLCFYLGTSLQQQER